MAIEVDTLKQVMGHFCTGITVITAVDGDDPVGFTAQSFTSLSLDPPLVCFAPQKSSSTWPRIRAAGAFCVNILGDDQQGACSAFATKGADKFAGVSWRPAAATGSPQLDGVLAWVDCSIEAIHDAGDHEICVGRVQDIGMGDDGAPLLFFRGRYGRFEPSA